MFRSESAKNILKPLSSSACICICIIVFNVMFVKGYSIYSPQPQPQPQGEMPPSNPFQYQYQYQHDIRSRPYEHEPQAQAPVPVAVAPSYVPYIPTSAVTFAPYSQTPYYFPTHLQPQPQSNYFPERSEFYPQGEFPEDPQPLAYAIPILRAGQPTPVFERVNFYSKVQILDPRPKVDFSPNWFFYHGPRYNENAYRPPMISLPMPGVQHYETRERERENERFRFRRSLPNSNYENSDLDDNERITIRTIRETAHININLDLLNPDGISQDELKKPTKIEFPTNTDDNDNDSDSATTTGISRKFKRIDLDEILTFSKSRENYLMGSSKYSTVRKRRSPGLDVHLIRQMIKTDRVYTGSAPRKDKDSSKKTNSTGSGSKSKKKAKKHQLIIPKAQKVDFCISLGEKCGFLKESRGKNGSKESEECVTIMRQKKIINLKALQKYCQSIYDEIEKYYQAKLDAQNAAKNEDYSKQKSQTWGPDMSSSSPSGSRNSGGYFWQPASPSGSGSQGQGQPKSRSFSSSYQSHQHQHQQPQELLEGSSGSGIGMSMSVSHGGGSGGYRGGSGSRQNYYSPVPPPAPAISFNLQPLMVPQSQGQGQDHQNMAYSADTLRSY